MGSGYPVSGLVSTDKITQALPFSKPSSSSSSYGGNPLAATAAFVTLQTILEERLVEHAAAIGGFMLQSLQKLQEKYEFLGDVRGKGLFIGLDLVKNRQTKEPLAKKVTEQIYKESLRRGLLTMAYTDRVRINPPLSLPKDLAQQGIEILDEVFAWVHKKVEWWA
jgi:4-aminobutyrate aminotransferase-like enzyme